MFFPVALKEIIRVYVSTYENSIFGLYKYFKVSYSFIRN
jgi:hypothetical protein